MALADTIVAASSASGRSVRAVVRVSGPDALRSPGLTGLKAEQAGDRPKLLVARVYLIDGRSLPALAAAWRAPRSYTGEDMLELLLPGNPTLVERVLRRLTSMPGFRLAGPGEFTARAFLHGKITLDQAEGVAATIAAHTQEQLSAARDLAAGRTGAQYHAWAEELATLLALVEAGIDFADQEDVVPIAPSALFARLDVLTRAIESQGGQHAHQAADALPRVVLVGEPNAGKSTLFNALLGRPRAIQSPLPGTTRDVLEDRLDLSADAPGAGEVILCDSAGVGELTDPGQADTRAMDATRAAIARADVIVHCDPRALFAGDWPQGATVLRVQTKADLSIDPLPDRVGLRVCALDGSGLVSLRRAIADAACTSRAAGVSALLPRHRRALSAACHGLDAARQSIDPSAHALRDPALTAGALRDALDAIEELVGRIPPDQIIGRIFATFCIGK